MSLLKFKPFHSAYIVVKLKNLKLNSCVKITITIFIILLPLIIRAININDTV